MRGSCTDIARGCTVFNWTSSKWTSARWAILAGGLWAVILGQVHDPLAAQEPAGAVVAGAKPAEPGKPGESVKSERNLIERTGWVRFEIIGGRIAVLGHRCGQSRVVQVGEPTDLPREQLSIQLHTELLLLHYEDMQNERQITLDLDDQQRLVLTRSGSSPTADLKLVQPFRGPLTLSIGRDKPQTFTAGTLWHLALQQPELCEQSLFPLLETLRPHWRLPEQAAGIQQELLRHAGEDVLAERAKWREWVTQLDSDDFQERQAADQHLRGAGQAVVAWLRRLDRKQLSAEQAGRITDICQGLADISTDTPQRVAAWMLDDRCAWMALLRNEDAKVRMAAVSHLTLLFGKPLAFDPYAQLSDRERQISQLQVRFGKP